MVCESSIQTELNCIFPVLPIPRTRFVYGDFSILFCYSLSKLIHLFIILDFYTTNSLEAGLNSVLLLSHFICCFISIIIFCYYFPLMPMDPLPFLGGDCSILQGHTHCQISDRMKRSPFWSNERHPYLTLLGRLIEKTPDSNTQHCIHLV